MLNLIQLRAKNFSPISMGESYGNIVSIPNKCWQLGIIGFESKKENIKLAIGIWRQLMLTKYKLKIK